jgi:hypothetical protein
MLSTDTDAKLCRAEQWRDRRRERGKGKEKLRKKN